MPKRAIVDVDGTLWSLTARIRKLAKDMWDIEMDEPDSWNAHRKHMTDDEFYILVRAAHASQLYGSPYFGAYSLFDALNKQGYEVIVASHRTPQTAHYLVKWLQHNGLEPYSGVYTGVDKHFLIRPEDLVIDDAPHTIEHVVRMGAKAIGLTYRYNRDILGWVNREEVPNMQKPKGFHTLEEMAAWIMKPPPRVRKQDQ